MLQESILQNYSMRDNYGAFIFYSQVAKLFERPSYAGVWPHTQIHVALRQTCVVSTNICHMLRLLKPPPRRRNTTEPLFLLFTKYQKWKKMTYINEATAASYVE